MATIRSSIFEFAEPVLHAFGRRLHRLDDVDVLRPELERAGVDRGEIENVVDDRQQRRRRLGDGAGVFELLGIERSDAAVGQELGEADDVGQRRAQLVGDVVDEVVAQLLGADQGLVAFGQRALDVGARGHVEEGQQRRAVGQRQGGAIERQAVLARDPHFVAAPLLRQIDDPRAQAVPQLPVVEQRRAQAGDCVDVWPIGVARRLEPPHRGEGRIVQLHPSVGAEHRHAFLQRVERLARHAGHRVDLRGQRIALGRVVEQVGDAALRIGLATTRSARPSGRCQTLSIGSIA